jgi:hypothetical protein
MRKRAARLAASMAVVGLFAASVPAAASANDGLTIRYHDEGKPLVIKVNL